MYPDGSVISEKNTTPNVNLIKEKVEAIYIDYSYDQVGNAVPYRYTKYGYDSYGRQSWAAEISSNKEPTKEQIDKLKLLIITMRKIRSYSSDMP